MQNQVRLKDDELFAALAEVYLQLRMPLHAALQAAQADLKCRDEAVLVPAAA